MTCALISLYLEIYKCQNPHIDPPIPPDTHKKTKEGRINKRGASRTEVGQTVAVPHCLVWNQNKPCDASGETCAVFPHLRQWPP